MRFHGDTLHLLADRRMAATLLLGFASGLPLALTGSTLQAWLSDAGVDIATIGVFALVGLPYTLKPLWAPLVDRYALPWLGRRRGWMALTQLALAAVLWRVGTIDPAERLTALAAAALAIAFLSATQDIVIDAWRTETLDPRQYGAAASLHILGYRLAMLASGAGALMLADRIPWSAVYPLLGIVMAASALATWWAPEPAAIRSPRSLGEAVVAPLAEFLRRDHAVAILSFVVLYKLGDAMAAALTTPFLLDIGFSKTQIGAVTKVVGLAATLGGAVVGGTLLATLGIVRSLWLFGALQALSNLCFYGVAVVGARVDALTGAVIVENLCGGMGTAAYTACLMALCDKRYTATQYALLTAVMALTRTVATAPSGVIAAALGWPGYFLLSAAAALPALVLLAGAARWFSARQEAVVT